MAAIGGVVIVLGCFLPWWRVGGGEGLPVVSGNAFEGSGIVVFLVGVATLFLVALPYAIGDRPTGLDRWVSYAILAAVGWLGLAWRVADLLLTGAFDFAEPVEVFTNGPGLWVAGIGLTILARAAYQMTREPVYR